MHLPPNHQPEPNFSKIRFCLILTAMAGAFLGLFITSNSASLRVDATDKVERDREISSLLKAREKFQQELQPKQEEIERETSPEHPKEIFANIKPVSPLNLQTNSPLNLSEVGGDRQTDISPVDEVISPVNETDEIANLTTDFLKDFLQYLETDIIKDETSPRTGILPVDKKASPTDEDTEIEVKTKEINPLESWNFPPRNSPADFLASGSTDDTEETEEISSRELLETSVENQQTSGILLTLNDAILLALENNRDLKNQYLDRIVQRNELKVAEDIFAPNFTPRASLEVNRNDSALGIPNGGGLNLSANVLLRLPNGAELKLDLGGVGSLGGGDDSFNSIGQNIEFGLRQPLLRGAGSEINRIPIKIARFTEKSNILTLKSRVIETVTNVIRTYRGLIQSQQQLKIEENALEDAQKRLEDLQILIDFGREARVKAVLFQEEIANRELNVLRLKNSLEQQKLELLGILDLERKVEIVMAEIQEVETPSLNIEEITEIALKNKPEYLQAQLSIETARLNLLNAENALKWQLDLGATYTNNSSSFEGIEDLRAALTLSQEFGDLKQKKLDLKQSQIDLVKAENDLHEARQNLEIAVEKAVRDVKLSLEEVKLARLSTDFAEQRLQIERDKLALGAEDANVQEVVRAQESVVDARNAELNAKIDYLNSLTSLSQTLGTTLEELGIEFNDGLGEVVFEED